MSANKRAEYGLILAALKLSFIYLEEVLSWSAASVLIFLASLNEPGLVNLSSDEEGLLLFSVAIFSLIGARAGVVCLGLPPECLLCLSSAAELDLTRGGALSLPPPSS